MTIRIIDKKEARAAATRTLARPNRDHCISTWWRVPLIFGRLTAEDYEDRVAADPAHRRCATDGLRRDETRVQPGDYLDPEKRSIANGITIEFADGRKLKSGRRIPDRPTAGAPQEHPGAGQEVPRNLARRFPPKQQQRILEFRRSTRRRLEAMPVSRYVDLYVVYEDPIPERSNMSPRLRAR